MGTMLRAKVCGSYTVEAVFLFPILVFLVVFMLQISMAWCEKVQQVSEDMETLQQLDSREAFLDASVWKAMKEQVEQYGH